MKITIPNKLNTTTRNAMRQCGYVEMLDRRSGQTSYARGLARGRYPRFHVYIKEAGENLLVNLHVDQKQASYERHNAHSGEYDSEVVKQEWQRIRQILGRVIVSEPDHQDKTEEENEPASVEAEDDKKGLFSRLFG